MQETGTDLKARRTAAGFSQRRLAALAGIHHSAVQYWERQAELDPRAYAVQRMAKALDWRIIGRSRARARHGVLGRAGDELGPEFWIEFASLIPWRLFRKVTRVKCGAKTRRGTECAALSVPGRRRCRFHGGLSTGPKTQEGRDRIAEAQRCRWAKRRS